jgi:guanine deaminase
MRSPKDYLGMAVDLALSNVREHGGRPFGAVLVKDDEVVATGVNDTLATHDPTAHAELQAVRAASRILKSPRLDGCTIYASGQPCPMCLAAMYLTGIRRAYYAYSNEDGEPFGLTTAGIYAELRKPLADQSLEILYVPVRPEGDDLYEVWRRSGEV